MISVDDGFQMKRPQTTTTMQKFNPFFTQVGLPHLCNIIIYYSSSVITIYNITGKIHRIF